jgi:hypothetical protein
MEGERRGRDTIGKERRGVKEIGEEGKEGTLNCYRFPMHDYVSSMSA